jgi:hypothetical protein
LKRALLFVCDVVIFSMRACAGVAIVCGVGLLLSAGWLEELNGRIDV